MTEEASVTRTLWMFTYEECRFDYRQDRHNVPCHSIAFYAFSEEDLERQVQEWVTSAPYKVRRLSLINYPGGFSVHHRYLPGTVAAS